MGIKRSEIFLLEQLADLMPRYGCELQLGALAVGAYHIWVDVVGFDIPRCARDSSASM